VNSSDEREAIGAGPRTVSCSCRSPALRLNPRRGIRRLTFFFVKLVRVNWFRLRPPPRYGMKCNLGMSVFGPVGELQFFKDCWVNKLCCLPITQEALDPFIPLSALRKKHAVGPLGDPFNGRPLGTSDVYVHNYFRGIARRAQLHRGIDSRSVVHLQFTETVLLSREQLCPCWWSGASICPLRTNRSGEFGRLRGLRENQRSAWFQGLRRNDRADRFRLFGSTSLGRHHRSCKGWGDRLRHRRPLVFWCILCYGGRGGGQRRAPFGEPEVRQQAKEPQDERNDNADST
jgi:hypothetical protein